MNILYVIPLTLVSYLTFTSFITLGTSFLFVSNIFRTIFLENKTTFFDKTRFRLLNEYVDLVINLYIFTVILTTPLYIFYSLIVLTYAFIYIPLVVLVGLIIVVTGVYIILVLLYISTDIGTEYRPDVLSRFDNIVSLSRVELIKLSILGLFYSASVIYVYLFAVSIILIPIGLTLQ